MNFPARTAVLWSVLLLSVPVAAIAQTVNDRAAAVRQDRATMEKDPRWLYNDFKRGFAESKRTGKPLLVVLRCVPCLACAGIDAQVLKQAELELASLLDQFVCVRVINANALDLSLFQFDYDLSFSTMIFNGDGTVYGRYGSWTHQHEFQNTTVSGYQRALEAALEIHRGYPGNKATLARKQGGPIPFKTPVEIPMLAAKYKTDLDWEGKVVQSCVHCHQIGDAIRASYRDQKKIIPAEWIYPLPAPETIGLTMAPDQVARVESVAAGSIAAKAGVQPGDEIISLDRQPLISIADVSWALHHAPEAGALSVDVKRGNKRMKLALDLPANWRAKTDISKRVGIWPMRGMALGGLVLQDLSDEDRSARALGKNKMALFAKNVGQYGKNAAAKNAGFQKEDLLVEIDGRTDRVTEGELIGNLLREHQPGEKIKVVVVRGKERIELTLPMQ